MHPNRWTDEEGNYCMFFPGFSELYSDKISRELSHKYQVNSCSEFVVTSSLGDTNLETFVHDLFLFCKAYQEFVGFERKELDKYSQITQRTSAPGNLESKGFLRLQKCSLRTLLCF